MSGRMASGESAAAAYEGRLAQELAELEVLGISGFLDSQPFLSFFLVVEPVAGW